MKTTIIAIFVAFCLGRYAEASGAITIEIITNDSGSHYTLHKQGYYADMESMTPGEIEAWLREAIKRIADHDMILIYADDRTPFRAVLDMLRRFKAAGVRNFAVCTGTGADVQPGLSASLDDIHLHSPTVASPPK